MTDHVTPRQFYESEGVEDWRIVGDGANAYFRVGSFAEAVRLVAAIGELEGVDQHPPHIELRPGGVNVRLATVTEEYYGMSRRDVEMAGRISSAARQLGLTGDATAVQSLLVIPGAKVIAEVMPFWRAVLGYVPRPDSPEEDLVDPRGRGVPLWFEEMQELRGDGRGSIHMAVWVPPEQAEARIEAALAAGGRMVHTESAPSWWTLADPAGNEVDIATVGARR